MEQDRTRGGSPILEKGDTRRVDVRLLVAPPDRAPPSAGLSSLARILAPAFYLDVGNVCNQRCLYCAVERDVLYRTTLSAALAQAAGAVALGYRAAAFIGGEPTIWPHLHAALERLSELGVRRSILTTNGLMLAYRAETERLVREGVDVFGVSLDDFEAERQRRLCQRDDNPEILARAMDNLAVTDADCYFYTVVTAELSGRGGRFGEQAAALAARFRRRPAFFLAALKPLEEAERQSKHLEISLTASVAEVRAVAAALDRSGSGAVLAVRDFPLCVLGDLTPLSMDLLHRNASLDLDSGRILESCLAADRTLVDVCTRCSLRPWCPAIYRRYVERFGVGEFRAVRMP